MSTDISPRRVVILGITGSVGKSAEKLLSNNPQHFTLVGASAHSRYDSCVMRDIPLFNTQEEMQNSDAFDAFLHQCTPDIVLNAISGFDGLWFSERVLQCGIPLALANKETLIAGGEWILRQAQENNVHIFPVDSEHAAMFDCLADREVFCRTGVIRYAPFSRILLTCSGGALRGWTKDQVRNATKADALRHPTWNMGQNITVDSATLANKCLEYIEAMHLFNALPEQISITLHRASQVHCLIEYPDGTTMAHISPADMQYAIMTALSFPEKYSCGLPHQDICNTPLLLEFSPAPSEDIFPFLGLLPLLANTGKNLPLVFLSANEVARNAFLREEISLGTLHDTVLSLVHKSPLYSLCTKKDILSCHQETLQKTKDILSQHSTLHPT